MYKDSDFEFVRPSLNTLLPEKIIEPTKYADTDASDNKPVSWAILQSKDGRDYLYADQNQIPTDSTGNLLTPLILWNAKTGEFARVYGSSLLSSGIWQVTINRRIFGTQWAAYFNTPNTVDDLWIVCESGDYMTFKMQTNIQFKQGGTSGIIPLGRRHLRSKIRKWQNGRLMPEIDPSYTAPTRSWSMVFYDWNNNPLSHVYKEDKALTLLFETSLGGVNTYPENRGYYKIQTNIDLLPQDVVHFLEQYEYPLINPKLDVRVVAFRPHPEIEPGGFNGWYEINRSRERMLEVIDNPSDRFDLSYPSYEAPGVLENVHPVYLPYLIATSIPSYRGWSYKTDALYSLFKRWVYDNEDLNINLPYIYDWWGVQEKWNAYRTDFVFAYNVGNQAVLPVIGNPAWQLQGSLMFGYALWDMMYPRVNDIMTFQPLNKSDQDIPSIFQNPAEKYDQLDPTGQYLDLEIMQKIEGLSLLLDHYHRKVPIPDGKQHLLEKIGLAPPFHIDEHDPAGDRKLDKIFKQVLREYFDQWYKPVTPGTTVKAWLWEEGYHAEWISFVYKPKEFGTKYKAKLYSQNMYVLFNETVGHVRVFSLTQIIPPDPVLDKSVKNYGTNTYILLEDKKAMWHKHTAYILGEYRKLTRVFKQGIYILYDLV